MPAPSPAATELRCGQTRRQQLTVKFDYLFFEAAAGEVVSITVAPEPGEDPNFEPEFQLKGPDGDAVFFVNGSPPRLCRSEIHQCETVPLPASGTYLIAVNDDGKKQKGRYNITLEAVSATANGESNGPPAPACRRTNDGGRADGTQPIGIGDSAGGSLDAAGETDTFAFALAADHTISLRLDAAVPAGSPFDPRWQLFDPAGQKVGDDACDLGAACERGPLAAGVYTVKVFDAEYATTGDYTLTLQNPAAISTTTTTTVTTITAVTTTTPGPVTTSTTLPYVLSHTLRRVPDQGEKLGVAIAATEITADDTRLAIGVPGDQTGGTVAGTVYVVRVREQDLLREKYAEIEQTLVAPDGSAPEDGFALSVAITPAGIAVGAPRAAFNSVSEAGVVHVFSGGVPDRVLRAQEPVARGEFGATLAVEGDTLFVGAPGERERTGRVYFFDGAGTTPRGFYPDASLSATLLAAGDAIGAGDRFGSAVATFRDGARDLLAIGAPADGTRPGRVFLFDAVAQTWLVLASPSAERGDGFGTALAFVDATLVIGAPGVGKVFLKPVDETVTLLVHRPELAGFGRTLQGRAADGSVLVGAPAAFSSPGGVPGGLVLQVPLRDPTAATRFAKPGPRAGDEYGASLTAAGDLIFVGAPGDYSGNNDSGAVYAHRSGADAPLAIFRKRFVDSGFGAAIAGDAERVLIGAPADEDGKGTLFAFEARTGQWLGVKRTGREEGDNLGQSVALFDAASGAPGGTAVVGAPKAGNGGTIYRSFLGLDALLATLNPDPTPPGDDPREERDQFGFSVTSVEDEVFVGAPGYGDSDIGRVFGYRLRNDRLELRRAIGSAVPSAGAKFGAAVAAQGDTVVVGAPFDNPTGVDAGAAYVFRRPGLEQPENRPLVIEDGLPGDLFGAAVAVSDDYIAVGAPGRLGNLGQVYVFDRHDRALLRVIDYPGNNGDVGVEFGAAVAIVDGFILVGAPKAPGATEPIVGRAFLIDPQTGAQVIEGGIGNPEQGAGDQFGAALAAAPFGFVIGAPGVGRAYVFLRSGPPPAMSGAQVLRMLADLVVPNAFAASQAVAESGCGDGIVDPRTEQCDDGNDIDTDSCSNSCKVPCCIIEPRGRIAMPGRCNDFNPCTDDSFDPATQRCVNVPNGQCCTSNDSCAGQNQVCSVCAGCSLFNWDCCDDGDKCLLSSEQCAGKPCFDKPYCECQGGLTCDDGSVPTEAMTDGFETACSALRDASLSDDETAVATTRNSAKQARLALRATRRETKRAFRTGAISKDCRKQLLAKVKLVRVSMPKGNCVRKCSKDSEARCGRKAKR